MNTHSAPSQNWKFVNRAIVHLEQCRNDKGDILVALKDANYDQYIQLCKYPVFILFLILGNNNNLHTKKKYK